MPPTRSRIAIIAMASFGLICLAGADAAELLGTLQDLVGTVEIDRDGATISATAGADVYRGDVIRTLPGASGRVVITWLEHDEGPIEGDITLGTDAEVELALEPGSARRPASKSRRGWTTLRFWRSWFWGGTRTECAGPEGTVFSVAVGPSPDGTGQEGASKVIVLEGAVRLESWGRRGLGRPVRVTKGQRADLGAGRGLVPTMVASPVSASVEDVERILTTLDNHPLLVRNPVAPGKAYRAGSVTALDDRVRICAEAILETPATDPGAPPRYLTTPGEVGDLLASMGLLRTAGSLFAAEQQKLVEAGADPLLIADLKLRMAGVSYKLGQDDEAKAQALAAVALSQDPMTKAEAYDAAALVTFGTNPEEARDYQERAFELDPGGLRPYVLGRTGTGPGPSGLIHGDVFWRGGPP